jgi:hypothetical protein
VFIPFVEGMLHDRVVPAIERQGYQPALVSVAGCDESYWMVLTEIARREPNSLCVVEHDVESQPDYLDELRDCPEPYCFNAYDFRAGDWEDVNIEYAPLGHTRFAGEALLILATLPRRHWIGLDKWIGERMAACGIRPHMHGGRVVHLSVCPPSLH